VLVERKAFINDETTIALKTYEIWPAEGIGLLLTTWGLVSIDRGTTFSVLWDRVPAPHQLPPHEGFFHLSHRSATVDLIPRYFGGHLRMENLCEGCNYEGGEDPLYRP